MTTRERMCVGLRASVVWAAVAAPGLSARPVVGQVALPSQPDLARLVDLSAQRLHLRISYDEQLLKSKVTLRTDAPLTDDELWRLTNRLLAEQGLTTVRIGDDDTIAVVKIATASQVARLEPIKDIRAESTPSDAVAPSIVRPGFRRVLVSLQRASPKDVAAAVGLVLSKSLGVAVGGSAGGGAGTGGADGDQSGSLVIADFAPQLDLALKIVERLDGPEGGAVVREIAARNIDPARLAAQAKQIVDKRKAVGGRDLRGELMPTVAGSALLLIAPPASVDEWERIIASVDQREPIERRTYAPGAFGMKEVSNLIEQTVRGGGSGGAAADDRWKIIQDDLTGTLIVTCTPAQHEQIADLLNRLASMPAQTRRPVRTFLIRNRGVKEIQQLIEDLLRAGVLEAQAPGDSGAAAPPGQVPADTAPAVGGSAQTTPRPFAAGSGSPETPSKWPLAPNGTRTQARNTGSNSALTLTSDESTNTLIAVGEPRLLAQVEQLLPTLDVRQPQVMLEAFLVSLSDNQTLDLGAELEYLHVSGDTLIRLSSLFGLSTAAGTGGGATRAVGDSTGFTGAVLNPGDFSVVVKALEALNKGRSLSAPKILVANNQQATFNSVLQQPFANTNASTTVSTTSFGGTQDAGTTISVKPQIAQGDHLSLTYSVSLSAFTGAASNPNLPPPRQQNSVQSMATIPDGYTVVVGGLEATTDGDSVSQVPGIGSLPLVGELFKDRSKSKLRTRFYVFLRANILRNTTFEDLKYISDQDTGVAGVPTGWPEVTPRVIR